MKHIFLDFEMNAIPRKNKEARALLRSEIVEIGAVKLDENYQQIDKYSAYVHPELCPITENCTKITGITSSDVESAKTFADALQDFIAWIGTEPVRVYSWSDSDRKQLREEAAAKGVYPNGLERPFRRWMDFQRIYTHLVGLSQHSSLSLTNAMGAIEQDFAGKQHSAADDAENSAALLTLVKDKEAFEQRSRKIKEIMGLTKPAPVTLGDLFGDLLSGVDWDEE